MARMRYVKPEFWTDSNMISLSRDARLFYIGTWNFALCDNGHLPDDAVQLKMQVLPADDDVDVAELIEDLVRSGRMTRLWTEDGRVFLQVRKLPNHQKLENRWSPRCPACQSELSETPPTSANLSESLPTSPKLSEPLPNSAQEGRGGEFKNSFPSRTTGGDEEVVLELVPPPTKARSTHSYPPEFEAFWKLYPKRNGKRDGKYPASQQWAKAVRIAPVDTIMAAVRLHGQQCGDLPKDAERWLKNRGWEDYAAAAQAPTVTYDQLFTMADAKRAAELIREPWADKSQHPDDTTPRAQFIKSTRQQWIADHRGAIEDALTRRAG